MISRALAAMVIMACVCGMADGETPKGAVLYVSTQGNDSWSGKLPAANADKSDGPLASLQGARDKVRALKKAGGLPEGGVTVFVRGGMYCLSQTFTLDAGDTGSSASPVTYRAMEGETPILSGGKSIGNFTPWKGSILKTDVGAQGFKGVAFRHLFLNGVRQQLARYPNYDANNPYGGGWTYVDGKSIPMYQNIEGESKRTLVYKASDARNWSRPQELEVFIFARYNWWNDILRVASIDANTRTVTTVRDASYSMRPGDRYYIRNALEELDAPGEWYLDRDSSTLYYWPPESLEGKALTAPALKNVVKFEKVSNVTLRGFVIECCESTAVVLSDTTDCLVAGNVIRGAGEYRGSGVDVNGGRRNGVVGNDIYDIGSSGVSLNGGDRKTLTAAGNYAENNYIHHIGVFYKQGVGVSMSGVGNRASRNLIHDGPRMGVMFSGNNHVIELNHVRHVNLETEDTGAIYTGGRDWIGSRGSVIRYNYFHDMLGYGKDAKGNWISPHFAWGVYLDDNTGGVDVIGNIVVRCPRAGLHLHNARDNVIENNVFIDNRLQEIEYSGWNQNHRMWKEHFASMVKGYESVAAEPAWKNMRNMGLHPKDAVGADGLIMSGNVFRRNIVCYREESSLLYRTRDVPFDRNVFDENLIWHFGLPLKTGIFQVTPSGPNLVAGGDFEDGEAGAAPKGWIFQAKPVGAKATVGLQHAGGQKSLELYSGQGKDAKGKNLSPIITCADIACKPGQAYKLTAKVKADKPETHAVLAVQSYVANAYFWMKESAPKIGTEWKTLELTFKMPAPGDKDYNAQMKNLRVRLEVRSPESTVWFDDVCLQEGESLNEWDSWRARGMDRNSLVADPMFVDASKDDYRLKPESPAFKLGFKPIPVEKIGPYQDSLRASWPIVEAPGAREHPIK